MRLLESHLPRFDFAETHHIDVHAAPSAVLDAVPQAGLTRDPVSTVFMALRELPAALGGSARRGRFGLHDFVPLGRDGDRELAYGLVGSFWQAHGGLVPMADAQAFAAFEQPGVAKLVITFCAEPMGEITRLTTVTRVHCPDAASRRRFTPYWWLIRPASGWIRRRILARVKRLAEG